MCLELKSLLFTTVYLTELLQLIDLLLLYHYITKYPH